MSVLLGASRRLDGGWKSVKPRSKLGPVERKLATVLFADLVGSTALVGELDPEYARDLLERFYEAMEAEIALGGGTVEKFIGDAVVAVFGAPVAHDYDPERAVSAALAI